MSARGPGVTASVVTAYGMRPVGGFGVRGFRTHCPDCGHLSTVTNHMQTARKRAHDHRCKSAA